MKHITFLVIFFISSHLLSQVQIGEEIPGFSQGDQFGSDIDISDDGLRIIAGASFGENANDDTFAGYVIAYEFLNGSWAPLGQILEGDALGDQLGVSNVISGDGTTIAGGAPFSDDNGTSSGRVRAYRLENDTWVQIGQDLVGRPQDQLGLSMDISRDGRILAMGTVQSVTIFENVDGTWEELGNEIFAILPQTSFGRTVSLSSDGTRLAIGAPFNDDQFANAGQVQVYEFVNGDWAQIGQNINGNESGASIGIDDTVTLSGDGTTLAIGFIRADTATAPSVGEVRLYTLSDTNNWEVIATVTGDAESDFFGFSVSLNEDGQDLIVSAPTSTGLGSYLRAFRNNGSGYQALGQDLEVPQNTGRQVSMSSNGQAVVGYPFGAANGVASGVVRVFDLNEVLSLQDVNQITGLKLFPNPSNDRLSVQLEGNAEAVQVRIYNMLGQLALTSTEAQGIDISSLKSGSYIVSVRTDQGAISQMLIKN